MASKIMRTTAHINLSALQHNFQQVKKLAPHSRILAMGKANAYGHGLLPIATHLSEADALGVATYDEALTLRNAGITQPIVVMGGFINSDELSAMAAQHITPVIHQIEQVLMLQNTHLPSPMSVWLKVDTGMHRLGFIPDRVSAVYTQLLNNPNIQKPIGFMTHLACPDEANNPHTQQQIQTFNQTIQWEGPRTLASSAGILSWPNTHADWVRPGIMLYGVSPTTSQSASELGLKPVMSLSARLAEIKILNQGEMVGYGATWKCPENGKKIGVVSIGYGDGYPRHIRNDTPVLVNGKRCVIVGRVSMDFLTIDLSNQPDAAIGDRVLLWGEGLPVEEIARYAGTIGYELLCQLTSRVSFVFS